MSFPKNISIVPPKSQINHTSYRLANFPFDNIPDSIFEKKKFASENNVVKVKTVDFEEKQSPLRFKSYITIYAGDPYKPNNKKMIGIGV